MKEHLLVRHGSKDGAEAQVAEETAAESSTDPSKAVKDPVEAALEVENQRKVPRYNLSISCAYRKWRASRRR